MKKYQHLFYIILLSFLIVACRQEKSKPNDENNNNNSDVVDETPPVTPLSVRQLILLNINDNHGEIRGFEKIAAYAESLRDTATLVLLLSGGDIFSGNGYVDQYKQNGVLRRGYPMVDLMNSVGFIVHCMGNHDFDYGQTTLQERRNQANFPFLGANITVGNGSVLQSFNSTYTLDTLGLKIAFVAAIERRPETKKINLTGLTFGDPLEAFKRHSDLTLTHQIVVAMSHQGTDLDEIMLEDLAFTYPNVLISSHDHKVVNLLGVNGVRYVETGFDLQNVGKIVFDLDTAGRAKGLCTYQNVAISSLSEVDNNIKAKVDEYENNQELNRIIGSLDKKLSTKTEVGNLMTDALRLAPLAGVDVAAVNTGGVRESSMPAGNIIANSIFKADPFNNQMYTYTMTKTQLVNFVKNNYSKMHWSGIKVSLNASGSVSGVYDAQGEEFTKSSYTLGINDFWTVSSSNYQSKILSRETTAEILVNYIETQDALKKEDYEANRVNK